MRHLADSTVLVNSTATLPAIWREPSGEMLDVLQGAAPMAHIRLSDYPSIARGARVDREGGSSYRVIAVEPDGHGLAVLRLELWA